MVSGHWDGWWIATLATPDHICNNTLTFCKPCKKSEHASVVAKLAVNVDHVATLRQARGGTEPDPVSAAAIAELAGAEGIIVHLREDRRHVQDRDLKLLRHTVKTRLNMEMAATEEMIGIALSIKPEVCTIVPEK